MENMAERDTKKIGAGNNKSVAGKNHCCCRYADAGDVAAVIAAITQGIAETAAETGDREQSKNKPEPEAVDHAGQ